MVSTPWQGELLPVPIKKWGPRNCWFGKLAETTIKAIMSILKRLSTLHCRRSIIQLVLILLVGLLLTCGVSPSQTDGQAPSVVKLAGDPELPRDFRLPIPLFAAGSAWNQRVTAAEVLPASSQQILTTYRVLRGDTTFLQPAGEPPPTTWPFMDVNYDEFSTPVFRAGAGEAQVLLCDYEGNLSWPHAKFSIDQEGGPVPVPAPAAAAPRRLPCGTR